MKGCRWITLQELEDRRAERRRREHSYLLGLGDAHAALSPGSSLERHAILEAIAEGRTELDLGPGRDVYKYRLGAVDRELKRLVVSSGSARGSCIAGLAAADLRLRNTAAADAARRLRGLTPQHVKSGQAEKAAQQPPTARSVIDEGLRWRARQTP